MFKVLIVGTGPTGALIAHGLRRELQQKVTIVMWDKSRGTGGRMSTSRSDNSGSCTADLGAQYLTVTSEYSKKHARYYKDLTDSGLIKSLVGKIEGIKAKYIDPGTKDYVAPSGISSIVKHFVQKSEAAVRFDHHLAQVEVEHDARRSPKLAAVSRTMQTENGFDAVVVTMPVPQILQQQGLTQHSLEQNEQLRHQLEGIEYSSRYALGLFYAPGTPIDLPYAGKYVDGNPCIRWVSVDSRKRGVDEASLGPSVVVHTSVPFGIEHLEEDWSEVQPIIMQHLRDVIPSLPEPVSIKCHKWRYSQVNKPMEGSPGHVTLAEQPSYILLAAGDGFSHSNFDGCIESAESALRKLVHFFDGS